MNLVELKTILEATGFPVAYSHFVESDNQVLPVPPFICYLVAFSSNFSADNQIYQVIQNVQIELYTNEKDIDAENKVEVVLNEHEMPYSTTETFIGSEEIYQKIYEVRLL